MRIQVSVSIGLYGNMGVDQPVWYGHHGTDGLATSFLARDSRFWKL